VAFSVCAPVESDEVVHVALPEASDTAEHSVVVPSRNVTVPVGVAPAAATVAVMVTDLAGVDGFGVEPRFTLAAKLVHGLRHRAGCRADTTSCPSSWR
jgi:hypothetical protein